MSDTNTYTLTNTTTGEPYGDFTGAGPGGAIDALMASLGKGCYDAHSTGDGYGLVVWASVTDQEAGIVESTATLLVELKE